MSASKQKPVEPVNLISELQILGLASTNTLDIDQKNPPKDESVCFHCHLPVPPGIELTSVVNNEEKPVCCQGCKAVADAIVSSGHAHYYKVRSEPSAKGLELVPEFLSETKIYDQDSVQKEFVQTFSENQREASLILEGITCAACVWLNEQHISGLPGVVDVRVNYASRRAWVRWDNSVIKLSDILQAIRAIGYRAYPYNPDQQQTLHQREKRSYIRRLAVAGLFGMQVMMISISLYSGAWTGMDYQFETLFRWLSLVLTLPVLFYSATGFFRTAWNDLSNRRVGMDVPVSLGIAIAFGGSLLATIEGQGEIYFDSVVMFTFLLLVSRYFEWLARQRSSESVERLAHSLPLTANKLDVGGNINQVAASLLKVDDRILIRPGETIPADAVVVAGASSIDESLLSGESRPVDKVAGDSLIGGSVNTESPLQAKVTSVGSDTVLSGIHRMINAAQSDRPPIAQLADKIASKFIIGVISVACVVGGYWWISARDNWLDIFLSVLIVTCPCALSLATPAALSAGLNRMQGLGLLVKRARAIDALNKVTHVVFDKTGTLTTAKPLLQKTFLDDDSLRTRYLAIAASMEQQSEHPIAKAILQAAAGIAELPVRNLINHRGGGLSGQIEGREYMLGSIDLVQSNFSHKIPKGWLTAIEDGAATPVVLASVDRIHAVFLVQDSIRSDAGRLVEQLKQRHLKTLLMSGDRVSVSQRVGRQTGFEEIYGELKPDQKMAMVKDLQLHGASVLMIGDGINDAPVLSAADVSIAVGGATSVAKNSADIVMLGESLDMVLTAMSMARDIQSVIKQNFAWAIGYNVLAIPIAAAGFLSPWMAALGMSLSSLIVVANAMRLGYRNRVD